MDAVIQILQTLLEEFYAKLQTFSAAVPRELAMPSISNKIIVTIGMRRTGKTHFLMQTIKNFIDQQQIPLQKILYLNFEDDRLYPLSQDKLRQLLDSFYSIYPENHTRECYLFLDEIQNVEDWPLVIRRYFDSKQVKIFLTGSSSKLLSKEIATSLRGRSFAIEVWPYSFKEFLQAKSISFPKILGKPSLDKFIVLLREYLRNGGFPEIVGLPQSSQLEENCRTILQDYVSVVTLRDIVERHNIANILPLHYLINFLLKNSGRTISAHKMHSDLKSQGFSISKDSVHDYLSYIEDAYLGFFVPIYSESLRKVQSNPKKFYAVDTGLAKAFDIGFAENIGHSFENLIYLDLRRAGHTIHYYHTQTKTQEVDFLSQDKLGRLYLWQVCWDMTDEKTIAREISALEAAAKELNVPGKLITPATYFTEFLTVKSP